MVIEAAVCYIEKENEVLFIMPNRGDSRGRWNIPGGKIESNEQPRKTVEREVFEETGLKIESLEKHGVMKFYVEGTGLYYKLHLFSTRSFTGSLRPTSEGRLRWADKNNLPYDKMWPADVQWMPLVMTGKRFDADFYYDVDKTRVIKSEIRFRNKSVVKA